MSNVDFGIRVSLEGGQQVAQQSADISRNFTALEGVAQRLGAAFGAVVGTFAARGFVQLADSVTVLRNQLNLATGSIQQAEVAYGALFAIAQRSRQSFTELGTTFASISRATAELGISQNRLLNVTEAIGNAIAISGGSAAGAQAALVQLSQGFASGTLRGEELNSVMEQTPRLAKAIADGLGITVGQLRQLGQEGKLTAEAVLGALESQARVLSGEVQNSVATVAQASQVAQNALTALVGEIDRVTGASTGMAGAILAASQSLTDITQALRSVEDAGQSVSAVGTGFAVLFETLAVLGANVSFVLRGIGNELGALAAQAVAIASGEFAQAAAIRDAVRADAEKARADIDALSQRVLQARQLRELAQQSLEGVDTRAEDARLARQAQGQQRVTLATKATAEQLRAAAQEAKKQQQVLNELLGVTDDYVESLQRLATMRQRGKLSEDQYAAAIDKVIQRQPAVIAAERQRIAAAREYLGMQELREEGERELAEAEQAAQRARQDAIAQIEQQVRAAEDEAKVAQLVAQGNLTHAQAIQRVTLARLEDQRQRLVNDPAELAALEQKIALQKQLIELTDQAAARDANTKAAQDAAQQWRATADDIRGALTDAFRRAFESGESFGRAFGQVIEREIKARLASALAGLVTDGIIQVVGGALTGSSAGGSGTNWLQAASLAKDGYNLYSGTGLYAAAGNYAAVYSGAAYGTGFGTQQSAMLAAQEAGMVSQAGASTMSTWGAYAGYAALIAAAVMKASSDYDEGFRSEGARGLQQDIGGVGGWILGGLTADFSNLAKKIGFNDKWADLLSGATGVAKLFGHALPKLTDSGISGTLGQGGFAGERFDIYTSKGGIFRSDKQQGMYGDVPEELNRFLNDASRAVYAAAFDFGEAIGLPTKALERVNTDLRVSFTADAEENRKAIEAALQQYGDDLVAGYADAVKPLAQYGETTAQTIARVGGAIQGVNQVLESLGLTALQASIDGGKAAVSLQQLFGDLGTLQQAAGGFLGNFYSEQERTALALRGIGEALAEVGLQTPTTRDAFRSLVEAQDLTTQAGREAFAVLLGVSDAFASITPAARAAADILAERQQLERELLQLQGNTAAIRALERAEIDASNRALYDQIKALEDQQAAAELAERAASAAAEAAATAAQRMADAWAQLTAGALQGVQAAYAAVAQAVDAERQQVQSSAEQAIRLAQSRADDGIRALEQQARTIETTFGGLARAMADQAQRLDGVLAGDGGRASALQALRNGAAGIAAGLTPDPDALRQAAGTAAQIDTREFASALDYRRAVAETGALLRRVGSAASGRQTAELAAIAAQQVAIEQASAEEIAALEAARDAQLYVLDQQLAESRAQASTLVRISDGVQGVAGAIGALATAITAARALQGQQAPAADTGRWLDAGNTEVWNAAGGAVAARQAGATMDGTLIKGLRTQFTAAEAQAFVNDRLQADDIIGIYARAVAEGIDSAALDALMGWAPGTSLAEARRRGLPAFATGTAYVPSTGVAIVHEGERIIPAADNADLMRILRGDGGSGALVAEVRRLREEVAALRRESMAGHHATASATGKAARLLDDVVNGGASVATRAEA